MKIKLVLPPKKKVTHGPCDCPRPRGANKDPNDIPDCDCGYSKSDWMPHHDRDCAYKVHGAFHNLQVGVRYVMADLKP